ncbi:protection of telomeres protein 1a-like isoform X1 [Corylus avellana]|uniref:protection of telomeres protein 1a-like isoform X1 n=2 Tax=Corylus avellana TaxID=13451 RepID=UPI00286BA1E1|nr:protection of telomeres protein 1a-like isoform X1 [Corylus avellana]
MGDSDDYKFLQIRDAIAAVNQKVNLIGVIIEFGVPKKTRGTDWICTLKIVDESHPKPGISVNIFAESMEKLPHVVSAGDIIQLSHVVMKTHCGEVNVVFNKRFSSFALYEGKDGKDFLPYQVSSKFRPRDLDKKFIEGLRKWLVDFQLDEGLSNFSFLREIKEGDRIDLACKIVHICEVAKDEWMVFLWDGTDAPPISLPTKLEDDLSNPVPLQLEPVALQRDLLCTFPAVGTILRVIFDQGMQNQYLHLLHSGKWVKFVNVLCEVKSGFWLGILTSFTKLRYTPNDDQLISVRQRLYNERLSSERGCIPYWCFPWSRITEVDYDDVPFVTLMDVLTYSEVTAKFKCVARVVAALPWQAEDLRSPLGTYRIRLTLEDPTTRIHALLYGEDGEKFFDGYPSTDVLRLKMNKLLGVAVSDNAPRTPPWAQFCLKSYYLSKNEAWGSRQYRIFGTKLE